MHMHGFACVTVDADEDEPAEVTVPVPAGPEHPSVTEPDDGADDSDSDSDEPDETPAGSDGDDGDSDDSDDSAGDGSDEEPDAPPADGGDSDGDDGDGDGDDDDVTDEPPADNGDGDDASTHTVTFTLRGGGEPLDGFEIEVNEFGGGVAESGPIEYVDTLETDENGEVSIDLENGAYVALPQIGSANWVNMGDGFFNVDGEDRTFNMVLTRPEGDSTLTVRVTEFGSYSGDDGAPIEGAEVTISEWAREIEETDTTDADGVATFVVPVGEYSINVDAEGYLWVPETTDMMAEIATDFSEVEVNPQLFVDPPDHDLTLTVIDADTGGPIEEADIAGVGGRPGSGDALIGGVTDADGVAVMNAMEPLSDYTIDVRADGYESQTFNEPLTEDTERTIELVPESDT
ncbi:carboxypeptidase-like regulatory domain-containing protein [Halalkalicoccus tibetensis]|uniref:Carboxypeptidase-like regulatory domain-containing protein n=1 Tax=Halalkalicoccus tibetensis TaxID=175632 RepID=A0ABD5UYK9_9EURY